MAVFIDPVCSCGGNKAFDSVHMRFKSNIFIIDCDEIRFMFMQNLHLYIFDQGVDNQGNHGKIRDLYNSGKVMEKSGNFVKISPNQGTLHFCRLNVAKKLPNK